MRIHVIKGTRPHMLWGLPSTRRQITFETAGLADLIGWRPSQSLAEEHNPKRYGYLVPHLTCLGIKVSLDEKRELLGV